jgi:peptide/nickel transport system permease protein
VAGAWRIIVLHLVPYSIGVIPVSATFTSVTAILILPALSFLGFALPPPHAPWGTMLTNGLNHPTGGGGNQSSAGQSLLMESLLTP